MSMSGRYASFFILFASAMTACGDDTSGSGATSGTGGDATTSSGGNSASSSGSTSTPTSTGSSGDGGGGSASTNQGGGGSASSSDGGGGSASTNQGGGGSASSSDGGGGSANDGGGGSASSSDGGGGSANDGGGGSASTNQGGGGNGGADPCAGDCFDTECDPGLKCAEGPNGCGVCACDSPIVDIEPLTSLYIRDPAVLDRPEFAFGAVLDRLLESAQASASMDARDLYVAWFDTNNDAAGGVAGGIHCDGEINGFPIDCPRQEGVLARRAVEDIGTPADPLAEGHYKLVAIVHRFDKMPLDGSNCGQYRFSYSLKDAEAPADPADPDFNYLIFEGVLPNPRTDLGIRGCLPVAQYIAALGDAPDADARAGMLADFFFNGLPGFEPIIDWTHFRGEPNGSGQLRTNQFILSESAQPWAAREYYLARTGTTPADYQLVVTPETVKENAYGRLFSEDFVDDRKDDFQTWFVDEAVESLADATDVNDLFFPVPNEFNAGQSTQPGLISGLPEEDHIGDYVAQATGNTDFLDRIQGKIDEGSSGLTALQVIARAEQQTCAGCHQLLSYASDLGGDMHYFGTGALGFVHTLDEQFDQMGEVGYRMSDALTEQFFPRRVEILESFIQTQCESDDGLQAVSLSTPAILPGGKKRAIGGGLASGH